MHLSSDIKPWVLFEYMYVVLLLENLLPSNVSTHFLTLSIGYWGRLCKHTFLESEPALDFPSTHSFIPYASLYSLLSELLPLAN